MKFKALIDKLKSEGVGELTPVLIWDEDSEQYIGVTGIIVTSKSVILHTDTEHKE